jgi:hypothetical protein
MMDMFAFDPADHADTYTQQGWVRIPAGVNPEFHGLLVDYAHHHDEVGAYHIPGKKRQLVFDALDEIDVDQARDTIATLTGLARNALVISERHLQAYTDGAYLNPEAHKDRYSSQISVGLSVISPPQTTLALWPHGDRTVNQTDRAIYSHPAEPPTVEFHDNPRDVVVFAGHNTWHVRRRAAGTVNLYLKFNDFGYDPLGENPIRVASSMR